MSPMPKRPLTRRQRKQAATIAAAEAERATPTLPLTGQDATDKLFELASARAAEGNAPTTIGEWEQFILDAEADGILELPEDAGRSMTDDPDRAQYMRQLEATGPVPTLTSDDEFEDLMCNCYPDGWNHEEHCDLWYDDDFAHGLARWNPATEELEKAPEDWVPEVAPPVTQYNTTSHSKYATTVTTSGATYPVDDAWDYAWKTCRHYSVPVTLPDGTVIYPSSLNNPSTRQAGDITPDVGCYMSDAWHPEWLSYNLPWVDYGLPEVSPTALRHAIVTLLAAAKDGLLVEIGCIGGHGRTGTLLALMVAATSRLTPQECIRWVRTNHCDHAIEGPSQVRLIEAMAPFVRANSLTRDIPANLIEKCAPPPITRSTTGTTATYPATVGNANGTWVQGHMVDDDTQPTGKRWVNGHFEPATPVQGTPVADGGNPVGTRYEGAKGTWVKQEDGSWIQVTADGCIIETPGASPSNPTGTRPAPTSDAGPLTGTGGAKTSEAEHLDPRDPRYGTREAEAKARGKALAAARRAVQPARPGAVRLAEGKYITTRKVDPGKLTGHGPKVITEILGGNVTRVTYKDGTVATQTGGATTIDTSEVSPLA